MLSGIPRRANDRDDLGTRSRHWSFDKRVSLDTIVAIIGMAIFVGGPFVIWGRAMESRVLVMEVQNDARAKADADRETRAVEAVRVMGARVDKLTDQFSGLQLSIGLISNKLGVSK